MLYLRARILIHLYNNTNIYAVKHVYCLRNLENKNVFLQPLNFIVSLLNQNNLDCINGTDVQYFRYENDIYILEYPSQKKELILWVSTQDDEISIGFDKNRECIWHTHMSQFGAYEPETELKETVEFISGLFGGRQIIVTDKKNEMYVTDTPEDIDEFGNKMILKSWNDF